MSKYKTFKEFYDDRLLPELTVLDGERKRVDRKVVLIILVVIAVIYITGRFMTTAAPYIQVPAGILGLVAASLVSKNYRQSFKNKIITKITAYMDENLAYSPEGTVPKEAFMRSAIFQQSCEYYKGEDHFNGMLDKTAVEFSEVVAKHKTSSGTGSDRKESYSTIFKGIFFVADFNKNFQGHTVVLPDTAEKLLGKFGQRLQGMSSRGKLVKLEDPEFEKEFCVYADDQVEARYILSTSLMQRILEFKRKWNTKVFLSFRDSKVYIAIRMNKNLFETRLFKSIVDYKFIEENTYFLTLLTGIVDDLNLNTRIWTKA